MNPRLKRVLFSSLKSGLVQAYLAKLVLSSTSIQGWLITFITGQLFEKIAVPILNGAIRTGELYYDNMSGKVQLRSLRKAEEDNDAEEYNKRLRDIIS